MFRRRRELKTDYRQRLALLKSGLPRIVIRRTSNNIKAQAVEATATGDKTRAEANSSELREFGWAFHGGSVPAAYLVGYLAGAKALSAGVKKAVPDMGIQFSRAGTSLFAALKGVADAGMEVPATELDESRINGTHIAEYARKMKAQSKNIYQRHFSAYIKKGANPEEMPQKFSAAKSEIAKKYKLNQKAEA